MTWAILRDLVGIHFYIFPTFTGLRTALVAHVMVSQGYHPFSTWFDDVDRFKSDSGSENMEIGQHLWSSCTFHIFLGSIHDVTNRHHNTLGSWPIPIWLVFQRRSSNEGLPRAEVRLGRTLHLSWPATEMDLFEGCIPQPLKEAEDDKIMGSLFSDEAKWEWFVHHLPTIAGQQVALLELDRLNLHLDRSSSTLNPTLRQPKNSVSVAWSTHVV